MSKSDAQGATPKSRFPNAKYEAQHTKSKTILPVFKTQSPKLNINKSKVIQLRIPTISQRTNSQTQNAHCKILNPKHKCQSMHSLIGTQKPESKVQGPKSKAQSPQSRAQIAESKIWNPRCKIESPRSKVLNPKHTV